MNTMIFPPKTFGPFLCVVLLCSLCSCAPISSSSSNQSTPPAKPHADNQWHMHLESDDKIQTSTPFEVNGRRMVVKEVPFKATKTQPDGSVHRNLVTYYNWHKIENAHIRSAAAVYDADTGQAIFPMDYAFIIPIPGQAVYVMPGNERAGNMRQWYELNVTTGELSPAPVINVFGISRSQRVKTTSLVDDYQKKAAVIVREDPDSTPAKPLYQLQVFPAPETGVETVTYTRIESKDTDARSFSTGRYVLLKRVGVDDKKSTVILDDDGTYCLETEEKIGLFSYRDPGNIYKYLRVLGIRAPGTDAMDDLWLILDESGRFGAPAGVVGFRPVYAHWSPDHGPGGAINAWLVRYARDGENQVKWEGVSRNFKPYPGGHQYVEAVIFESDWFYPSRDTYGKGDTRKRAFMAVKVPGANWELHAGDELPDLGSGVRQVLLHGKSLSQLQSDLEATTLQAQLASARYEKAQIEAKKQARVDALEQKFQSAIRNKAWNTAENLANQMEGDAYYTLARTMPRPTVLFLQRAMERTSSELLKADLKRMAVEAKALYDREVYAYQAWQLKQNDQRPFTGGGAVSSYEPKAAPPKTMAQYMHDHAQAQRYKDNSSYSQHKVNMGWYRPSGY